MYVHVDSVCVHFVNFSRNLIHTHPVTVMHRIEKLRDGTFYVESTFLRMIEFREKL